MDSTTITSKYKAGSHWTRRFILIASDLLALILSVALGWLVSMVVRAQINPSLPDPPIDIFARNQAVIFASLIVIVIGFSWVWGHYNRFKPYWSEVKEILKIISFVVVVDAVYLFTVKSHFSRVWFFSIIVLAAFLLPLFRVYAKRMMAFMGLWYRPTVIVGCGDNARLSALAIESDFTMGHKVVAFLNPDGASCSGEVLNGYPILPLGSNPVKTFLSLGCPYVVFALDAFPRDEKEKHILDQWMAMCSDMMIAPPVSGLPLYGAENVHILKHEALLLRLKNNLARHWPKLIKRTFDIVVSTLLLILLAPLFVFLAWRVRRDGGSVTYAQERVGYKGKPFHCIKFRSMIVNADQVLAELLENDPEAMEGWERDFKLKNDPRITKIGDMLRKTSLDELPQLWNVIRGDMSLVGPRPIVEGEVERYGDFISYYEESRPGMTGLWQVSGRNDVDYKQRIDLDVWYARNWSLWHDIVILMKTVPVVFLREGSY